MAITTISQLRDKVNEQAQYICIRCASGTGGANSYMQTWTGNQGIPTGSAPVSGVSGDVPTNATIGAFPLPVVSSGDLYLVDVNIRGFWPGTLMIYDRLWHNSGLSVTTTTLQSVNSVALPARANGGVGAQIWLDNYGAVGAGTFSSCICTYTNTAGTGSRTATVNGAAGSSTNGRAFIFTLDAGDDGVQSIQSMTLGTSRTSGSHGLVIRRPLVRIPLAGVTSVGKVDMFDIPMTLIPDDACIEFIYHIGLVPTGTNILAAGTLNFVEA